MSKVMLALGSFIVGACCASIVSVGIQTSTLAQSSPPSGPVPATVIGNGLVAVVPPLSSRSADSTFGGNMTMGLDGLNCEHCTFKNATFIYGGGAFNIPQFTFVGQTTVITKGAAQNTVQLLTLLGMLGQKPAPSGPPPAFRPPATEFAIDQAMPKTIELISAK